MVWVCVCQEEEGGCTSLLTRSQRYCNPGLIVFLSHTFLMQMKGRPVTDLVTYSILATDYTSYATAWSCRPTTFGFHLEFKWIFSRQPKLDQDTKAQLIDMMQQAGISTSGMVDVQCADWQQRISNSKEKNEIAENDSKRSFLAQKSANRMMILDYIELHVALAFIYLNFYGNSPLSLFSYPLLRLKKKLVVSYYYFLCTPI